MAHGAVLRQLLSAENLDRVTLRSLGGEGQPAHIDAAEVDLHAPRVPPFHRNRTDRFHNHGRRRLRHERIVAAQRMRCGGRPARIVKLGLLKSHFRRGGIITLHELRIISHGSERRIAGVPGGLEERIRRKHLSSIGMEIEDESVAVVARHPHAVDESLIERMDGNDIASLPEKSRHVKRIVVGAGGRSRRRPHADERPVDVQLVVVVRRDAQRRRLHLVQLKRLAEKDVPVLKRPVDRRQLLCLKLARLVRARRLACHFSIGDPNT